MTARGPNLERRKDLERAIAKAGPKDELDLQSLAAIWNVAKPTFVNILRQIERQFEVPKYREGERGSHYYPAKKMLQVLLAWEKRNDQVVLDKQERAARILGQHRVDPKAMPNLPVGELAQLNRLAIEIEARERDQRLYIHRDEISQVIGGVFSSLSSYLSQLEQHIDPNGLLPKDIRAVLREGGTGLALRIHGEIKDMLDPNAQQPAKRSGSRKPAGRPRRAPPRRKSGGRGTRAAR